MNRASSRVEVGTSEFLSISDIDLGVSVELEQGSQGSSCVDTRSPLASRVVNGVSGHLSSGIWNLWIFPEDATRVSVPLRVLTSSSGLHSKRCPCIGNYLE